MGTPQAHAGKHPHASIEQQDITSSCDHFLSTLACSYFKGGTSSHSNSTSDTTVHRAHLMIIKGFKKVFSFSLEAYAHS